MGDKIKTTAEAVEAAVLPSLHEVHADPEAKVGLSSIPAALNTPVEHKSAARWAYERVILYIQNFEQQLDGDHEVAMGFVGGEAGVLRIEGMGYFDPDIITFYGSDGRWENATGAACQSIERDVAGAAKAQKRSTRQSHRL